MAGTPISCFWRPARAMSIRFPTTRHCLRRQHARNVPCLCTNPDKIMLTKEGTAFGAGRIAELYEALGGHVRWIGKPFPDIYASARDFLGSIDPKRICCIGDSIEHDIVGAASAGFASVLVTTGILETASDAERQALFVEHDVTPDFIMPKFLW